jgi:crotonobetainyl-CoA:carnitine CoA-transferase CaiB-like acyl-CoA transferase
LGKLNEAKIPCGSILPMDKVFEQSAAKEVVLTSIESDLNSQGLRTFVGNVTQMSKISHISPPPRFAEHTEEILLDRNIVNELEIGILKENGIIC